MKNAQTWNPEEYKRNAAFVSELAGAVLKLLDPRPGENILDLGCGEGTIAATLQAQGVQMTCVDASPEMIAAARARGLDAKVMDGTALHFAKKFDAVFSNAALHWMGKPKAVITGVWNALKPGGRFVAECGGKGNVRAIEAALENVAVNRGLRVQSPWFFPSPEEYRTLLEAQGFTVSEIALHPRFKPLPGDITVWLQLFAKPFLNTVPVEDQAAYIQDVREALEPVLCKDGVWTADYVRLRFAATKPA